MVLVVLYMVYIGRFMEVVSVLPSVTKYEFLNGSTGFFLNSMFKTSYIRTLLRNSTFQPLLLTRVFMSL
jgi:hypothetical protein